MSAGSRSGELIRRSNDDDEPAILDLLVSCLDWEPGARFADLYRWKHLSNPFGRSPGWVALDGDRVVGFRTFLRWEFVVAGEVVRAVRAVDTATHQEHRGQGIFRHLTEQAVTELTNEGVSFIFNTPNVHSLPGYLKMGWQAASQLPVLFRPTSPRSLVRVARSRVPAELWSCPTEAGVSAAEVLADGAALEQLLAGRVCPVDPRTRHSVSYLRWRYGYSPLLYRAVTGPAGLSDGVAFFRMRRRGSALELALGDVVAPGPAPDAAAKVLLKAVLRVASSADHVVRLADDGAPAAGFLPLPRQGPVLAYRPLADSAVGPQRLRLSLGDVELF